MVRRRMSAPKPSPPVHRRPPPPMQTSPMPTRTTAPPPASRPSTTGPSQPHVGPTPVSQGPGLFGQMAATAGGVAIGSAVGHAVGNMFTGGSRGDAELPQASEQMQQQPQQQQQQALSNPCEFEWKQFMECTETHSDISLCQGFNEIFKQCRAKYA